MEQIPDSQATNWLLLRLFNIYRGILAALFLIAYLNILPQPFWGEYPRLFLFTSIFYMFGAVVYEWLVQRHHPNIETQVLLQISSDIVAITLLMHASGGIQSGLGMLLIVSIAGCSLLSAGRMAVFFAAMASLAILIESVYDDLYYTGVANYTSAGILGATLFATALLTYISAQRLRASENLAQQRGQSLSYLSELNAQIIKHLQTGILVINVLNQISLANVAARRLLMCDKYIENKNLANIAPELSAQLGRWKNQLHHESYLFRPARSEIDLIANFTCLGEPAEGNILIFLEDATLTSQRAQQLKLVSLGQLTAGVAHEIRNPLGAISHAGQLLAESPDIQHKSDVRLLQIVLEQCQRINVMVENVLQLSRQGHAQASSLCLNDWISDYLREWCAQNELDDQQVKLVLDTAHDLNIDFDPSQLNQVVWNLCENGLRYSKKNPLLILRTGIGTDFQRPFLDIEDNGAGMSKKVREQVFEPFFTTEAKGTGLGLYIAREICAANQATLHLLRYDERGCCFRISFSETAIHPVGNTP